MLLPSLFWVTFLLPGSCLVRVLDAKHGQTARRSLFETVAIGYVYSFALALPVVVLGYWLELPLYVLSGWLVALSLAAGVFLLRSGARPRWHARGDAFVWTCGTILLVFWAAAAIQGGHIANDADFHLARVRELYEHGLRNVDPFTGTGFTHPYHTNALHAVIAAASQLTGLDPLQLWWGTLPWAKLVASMGIGTLAVRIAGQRFAGWLAAGTFLGSDFVYNWTLYPNQLAPLWLVPVGLAACLDWFDPLRAPSARVVVSCAALLLSLVHGLYAVYFVALAACLVAALASRQLLSRARPAREVIALVLLAGLALSLAAPALYVARTTHLPAQPNFDYQGGPPTRRAAKHERWVKGMNANEAGQLSLPVSHLLRGQPYQWLVLASVAVLFLRRRRDEALSLTVALTCCALVLSVPAIAQRASTAIGAAWILERLSGIVDMLALSLVAAGLSLILPERSRDSPYTRALLLSAITLLEAGRSATNAVPAEVVRSWEKRLVALAPADLLAPTLSFVRRDQAVLRRIPAGATVLTHPLAARQLRKLHDLRFVRASRNHTGVDDLLDRTVAMHDLLYAREPSPRVRELLWRYGIRYAIQKKDHPIRWLKRQPVIDETPAIALISLGPLVDKQQPRSKSPRRQ